MKKQIEINCNTESQYLATILGDLKPRNFEYNTNKNLFTQCKKGFLLMAKYDAYYTLSKMIFGLYLRWLSKNRDDVLKMNHTVDDPANIVI